MSKNSRKKIKLVSSEKTGHFYTTTKSKKNFSKKLKLKKFDPIARKYTIYLEEKIK